MINIDTLEKRSNNSLYIVYRVLSRRIIDENLKDSIRALFIINLDIIKNEMEKRGLNYEEIV